MQCNCSNFAAPAMALSGCVRESRPEQPTKTRELSALLAIRKQSLQSWAKEDYAWVTLFGSSLVALVVAFWL